MPYILQSIDHEKQQYCYRVNGNDKTVTFAFAWEKAYGVYQELKALGWIGSNINAPLADNVGKPAGFADFVIMSEEAGGYYEAVGEQLTCLLHPQFIAYEGKRIKARDDKGKLKTFHVIKWGAAVPFYVQRRNLKGVGGKRIKGEYTDITEVSE